MKTIKYIVVEQISIEDLEESVNAHIYNGFKPHGSMVVLPKTIEDDTLTFCYQPMIKEGKWILMI